MAKAPVARVKQGDFTGKQREATLKENAEEVAVRSEQMSMATAQQAKEFSENVHDARRPDEIIVDDDIEDLGGVDLNEQAKVVIRVNEDVEEMTYGYGNVYDMKAGGQYQVPKDVAEHLESLGLIWH